MDQLALAKQRLAEAFAEAAKPTPKKRRRGRRRRSSKPDTQDILLYRAHNELAKTLRFKKEGPGSKRLAGNLQVIPLGARKWHVFGGECQHIVIQRDGVLTCTDHEPAHLPPIPGYACSHEVAVRRHLTRLKVSGEVAA